MRRWFLRFALISLLIGAIAFGIWMSGPPVNKRNYGRIQVGMTKAQVDKLLDSPGKGAAAPPPEWRDREGLSN